jgi:tRNA dimethylallyltransferase
VKKIVVITGQTATGKTRLALEKASELNGELINADSRQAYKLLDIITGKDFVEKNFTQVRRIDNFSVGYYQLSTKVWLYDVVDPKQYYSSFDFASLALEVIKDVIKRGKVPIIIGGTYLYLYHLLYSVKNVGIAPDWVLRKKMDPMTVSELQRMLEKVKPELLETLNDSDRNNPRRLMRKIEIAKQKGESSTDLAIGALGLGEKLQISDLDIDYIGLRFADKERLHNAISQRVESRLQQGAIDEVRELIAQGYTENDPGMKTIGYRQFIKHLKGEATREQAIEEWKIREHQYAKRQYTFMKKDQNIVWKEV